MTVSVPVSISLGNKPPGWRHRTVKRSRLESPLNVEPYGVQILIGESLCPDRRQDAQAHTLPVAQTRCVWMLPDTVASRQRDRQNRPARRTRKRECACHEIGFDSKDRALGENDQTVARGKYVACRPQQATIPPTALLRRHIDLAGRAQVRAEEASGEELVASGKT